MTRQISGLVWARECQRPLGLPLRRPRGAKAAGLRFQDGLAKAMPMAKTGLWFEFEDALGRGVCQTDLILRWNGWIVVIEVKLTYSEEAWRQLEGLYLPVVQHIAAPRRVVGVQVVKNLRRDMAGASVAPTWEEAVEGAGEGRRMVWQWIGVPSQAVRMIAASAA